MPEVIIPVITTNHKGGQNYCIQVPQSTETDIGILQLTKDFSIFDAEAVALTRLVTSAEL